MLANESCFHCGLAFTLLTPETVIGLVYFFFLSSLFFTWRPGWRPGTGTWEDRYRGLFSCLRRGGFAVLLPAMASIASMEGLSVCGMGWGRSGYTL